MNKYATIFLTSLLLLNLAFLNYMKAQIINIPLGNTVVIDGKVSTNEWTDCDSIELSLPGGNNVIKIMIKHDASNLLLCYQGNLQSAGFQFPEVAFDVNNDKSPGWLSDDWWFHVSATDCEYNGEHSNYDSCAAIKNSWKAEPNFSPSGPAVDTVEISIPFSTIGFNPNTKDTLGISFMVNDFSSWKYWPASAHIDTPSTWGSAIFDMYTGLEFSKEIQEELSMIPNPTTGNMKISNLSGEGSIDIRNIQGEIVYTIHYSHTNSLFIQLPENLSNGLYVLVDRNKSATKSRKFILRK